MNSLLKVKGLKFTGMFNQIAGSRTLFAALFTLASTLSFTPQAYANRPAMDDTEEAMTEAENIPQAPSAVEMMMQQQTHQTQQTGDVLQLPAKEMQPGETIQIKLLDYPRRGMSMDKVQQEFGQPLAASDSVGKPPITRWTYNDRVVYFEYSTVLHVVAR